MQFTVPKFIEDKPKIVGPLTFQQFVYVGTAGGICFFLYFIVPISTFIIASIFLMTVASALAFMKIGNFPLPVLIKNLFIFLLNPKVYLWKRKTGPVLVMEERKEAKKDKEKKESVLKINKNSRLKELSTRIEIKSK